MKHLFSFYAKSNKKNKWKYRRENKIQARLLSKHRRRLDKEEIENASYR